ncbi:MAG: RDD family protein [Bacteroidota bacterium]
MASSNYASFGIRWVAHIIDYIILYIVNWIVLTLILAPIGFSVASANDFDLESMTEGDMVAAITTLMGALVAGSIVLLILRVIYGAFMESSKFQGTIGKLAVGIKVTGADGSKLTFVKALLRHIGKIISGMIIFIGYIMAAFTEKKQGLHDMIAGSIVVKK